MSKPLLVEYMQFNPIGSLNESNGAKYGIPGGFVVQGILQRSEAKNHNGRVYPKSILMRECQRYQKEYIDQNRALGELDHPESSVVNLNNVSHNVLKIWWEGDDLKGVVQVLDTPSGKILKSLFKEGITLGISSRGLGSVKELRNEGVVEVQDDFELICWDFVSNPSTQGAFMGMMKESVNKTITNKYGNVNDIITSILCEDGKCRI
jgi:hypothetical protein|tara:strand:+ start:3808 stop:4428 length:621 start_codon:yes stop_codon:yes gene_type:complete